MRLKKMKIAKTLCIASLAVMVGYAAFAQPDAEVVEYRTTISQGKPCGMCAAVLPAMRTTCPISSGRQKEKMESRMQAICSLGQKSLFIPEGW